MNKKGVRWVVQSNLTNPDDLIGLRGSCKQLNVPCIEVQIIPFSNELPAFDITPCNNIYYGSTTFNSLVYNNKVTRSGLFFDPELFTIENYINKWGQYMLNYGASITTFQNLIHSNHNSQKQLFIRPNDDSKSFAGEVKRFDEIKNWHEKLQSLSGSTLTLDSKIVVSEPYNIHYEWRLWIVNKKVIAASKYREYFKLSKAQGCPASVVAFAEERCNEYTPHDVFVMDICLCGNELYIIECGCMNGAGFYSANINQIVTAVTSYFSEVCCQS
jgi:hypothetical protein